MNLITNIFLFFSVFECLFKIFFENVMNKKEFHILKINHLCILQQNIIFIFKMILN